MNDPMQRLAIIHFNPIELYPPVMNLIDLLGRQPIPGLEVRVFTSAPPAGHRLYEPSGPGIRIIRSGSLLQMASLKRYAAYLHYYAGTLRRLIAWRPGAILYYETLSALPALFYRKWIRRRPVLVHYHEYMSLPEYRNGMFLNRWLHQMERRAYAGFTWISHTNEDRVAHFIQDHPGVAMPPVRVLPNYPPSSWSRPRTTTEGGPVRFVYIGALSLDTLYVREFAQWVAGQKGQAVWDIYSTNYSEEVKTFLESFGGTTIRFRGGVEYTDLPDVLAQYQVGVILYKGHIPNYVYNVPNKLYEYLACGLDVWFPHGMLSSLSMVTKGVFPKVMAVDFDRIGEMDWRAAVDRTGLVHRPSPYYCEQVLPTLIEPIKTCVE